MGTSKNGSNGGAPGGTRSGRGAEAQALAELLTRLQVHSELLKRDVLRLQQALAEINTAMTTSLDRVERLRSNTERLKAAFERSRSMPPRTAQKPPFGNRMAKPATEDRRAGRDRRSGCDRRRAADEPTGLMRWIEGTSLDRRKGGDRRRAQDRRRPQGSCRSPAPSVPRAKKAPPALTAKVVSLAAERAKRKAMHSPGL